MLLTSRASSSICWPSRTSMPSFCSSNSIGGSTTSTPSGMPPTPSSSRIALISCAASRNSATSAPIAPRMPSMPARQWSCAQPRRVEPVVLRRRAEVPDVRVAVAGEQRVARELVARPLADDGARGVADVVLVEAEQRAEPRARQRRARAREPVVVQAAEVDALLEIDLRVARRLQRPVPPVMRVDVVGPDDPGFVRFAGHLFPIRSRCEARPGRRRCERRSRNSRTPPPAWPRAHARGFFQLMQSFAAR